MAGGPVVPPQGNVPGPGEGGVGPKQIYDELIAQGAGTIRAIGIMANMINESGLNVETGAGGTAIDSNGYPVYGLVSWNTASYPNAGSLVTGNAQKDLKAQITYLAQTGGFNAANGSTYAEAAGNFAANYERCSTCQQGGDQYTSRVGNASTVAGWVDAGNWPDSAAAGTGQAQVETSAGTQSSATCVWKLPSIDLKITSIGGQCILSKSQARALLSALILVAGGTVALVAIVMIAAETPVGRQAASLLAVAPGGAAAKAAGAGAAAASVA